MSWVNSYGELASTVPLQAQVGSNHQGAEHAPVSISGLAPHLKSGHHHQNPAGGKAPQPYSIVDAALYASQSNPCLQAQCAEPGPFPHFPYGSNVKTLSHSLVRHRPSEATSIKWPQGSLSMRHS